MPNKAGTIFRRVFAPEGKKEDDGRDQWPSRASFILAAMGGCVGLGNLLRYPSQVYNNFGLQWFVPYLIAVFFLGIPLLILEIAIGQAYRGGCVIAYNHINPRLKGLGLGLIWNGYVIVVYYVVILAWVMNYFRNSFSSPLPWENRSNDFYMQDVIGNGERVAAVPGEDWIQYTGSGLVGETTGWTAFTWFVIWLCLYKGVAVTGRVVYFTMGLPVITVLVLLGRSGSLPNAIDGIRLYLGQWHGEKLAGRAIWQAAVGQVFFSIGLGMGYFTSYASYNSRHQNCVQDVLIIVFCNSLYEIFGSISVFGVIGFLGNLPTADTPPLGSFSVAFLTYPEAVAQMPGAQFWSFLFFLTLMVLGFSSAFALLDTVITMICDSEFGRNWKRVYVTTVAVLVSFLISLIYCSSFGYYMLDAVDTWVNNMSLVFVVFAEVVAATTIYRHFDVVGVVGWTAYLIHNISYIGGMVLGVIIGHTVSPEAGAGVGFGVFVTGLITALLVAKTPDTDCPRFWKKSIWLEKLFYLGFYSGYQITQDLNLAVATGKNWSIPFWWGTIVRYISAPILIIVLSLAYPAFEAVRNDPLHIFGFVIGLLSMVIVTAVLIVPRMMDTFVPVERRGEAHIPFSPNVAVAVMELSIGRRLEGQDSIDDARDTGSAWENKKVGGHKAVTDRDGSETGSGDTRFETIDNAPRKMTNVEMASREKQNVVL